MLRPGTRRALGLWLPVAGLAAFGWLAVQVYSSQADPERFGGDDAALNRLLGPPAPALEQAAVQHLEQGLALLNDTSLPPSERIRLYRERLGAAETLLVRSLRTQPVRARVVSQLAATRWELDPPLTAEGRANHLQVIELASRMAPTTPRVQMQLGELLLKMGRRDAAMRSFHRTLTLEPSLSIDVVRLLREHLLGAFELLEALPKHPTTLVALQQPFFADGQESVYAEAIDQALDELAPAIPPAVLQAYGYACLRLRDAARLRERMDALGTLPETAAEAERYRQRSRAHEALGSTAKALEDGRAARALLPESPGMAAHLGKLLVSSGDPEAAIGTFREALGLSARSFGTAAARAKLYRQIGQAEESRGQPGRAYDAYLMALELNPEERHAKRRVAEMQRAAGVH